ncbi:hypothetical protein VaNZ11_013577 [Volvox africanus]|uniref:Uncharacterized protein n=1 Tax=Volvox africanus TaxID=51714 RepID=A0ABQ5SIK1_9CHLO|nr:hypothetical protein VaNZ11_013577 [Volvox africanus]
MAGAKSASRGLLAVLFLLFILLQAEASMYSRRRGLKTAGLTEEEINAVMKEHDPRHILYKEKHKEGLKAHPEVKRYLEWRQMHKVDFSGRRVVYDYETAVPGRSPRCRFSLCRQDSARFHPALG